MVHPPRPSTGAADKLAKSAANANKVPSEALHSISAAKRAVTAWRRRLGRITRSSQRFRILKFDEEAELSIAYRRDSDGKPPGNTGPGAQSKPASSDDCVKAPKSAPTDKQFFLGLGYAPFASMGPCVPMKQTPSTAVTDDHADAPLPPYGQVKAAHVPDKPTGGTQISWPAVDATAESRPPS